MIRFRAIAYILGQFLLALAGTMLVPLAYGLLVGDPALQLFGPSIADHRCERRLAMGLGVAAGSRPDSSRRFANGRCRLGECRVFRLSSFLFLSRLPDLH